MTTRPPAKPVALLNQSQLDALRDQEVSRRRLLQQPGRLVATAALGTVVGTGIASAQEASPVADAVAVVALPDIEVPHTPAEAPVPEFEALTAEEAAILEALLARMLPGTEEDPGAYEAGVAYYIDHLLTQNEGLLERVYRDGPWARPYTGDTPPPEEEGVIWVPAEELGRYGYQSPLTPLAVYRQGLDLTNQHAVTTYGQAMAMLEPGDQDNVVWDLLRGDVEGFTAFSSFSFFQTIRHHIAEGMFSDPAYGGNRDMAGWKLVGYPGAQRGYLPSEIRGTADPRPPQSMSSLPHFHVGEHDDHENVVLPVRGTDDEEANP